MEFKNYIIYKKMLYIKYRLYIPNNAKLKIKIIKKIHESLSKKYIEKFFIYNKINGHYY